MIVDNYFWVIGKGEGDNSLVK